MNVKLCPQCGSGKVAIQDSSLSAIEVTAECTDCGWKGKGGELLTALMPSSPDLVAREVVKAYSSLVVKNVAQSLGLAMIQSGVVGRKDTKTLTRLIRAACFGAVKSTLDEIEEIQKEMRS